MRRHLSWLLTVAFVAMFAVPAFASNGELQIVATAFWGEFGENPKECDYWSLKHRGETAGQGFSSCQPPFMQIYASLQGASAGGITGAEYKLQIGPDDSPDAGNYQVLIEFVNPAFGTVNGSSITPADPAPRGVNLGSNACQTGDGSRVLLSTVIFNPLAFECGPGVVPPSLDYKGVAHSAPGNQFFRCPLFTLCDGPTFTKVCLGTDLVTCPTTQPPFPPLATCSTSGSFSINPANPGTCVKLKADVAANTIQSDTWTNVKNLYR